MKRLDKVSVKAKVNILKRMDENTIKLLAEREFQMLVMEMRPKGFRMSWQVSRYIVEHKLGRKYKFISGLLDFENSYSSWTFKGGISPKYYARLCRALNLANKKTDSYVRDFTPYAEVYGY